MAVLDDPVLRTMGEFFTKAALVTFGGAYAVLAGGRDISGLSAYEQ